MAGYELTRDDIEKIALTGKAVEDLAGDIAEIKEILKSDARNCQKCKDGIDQEIRDIRDQQNRWLGRDGIITAAFGAIGGTIVAGILWIVGVGR